MDPLNVIKSDLFPKASHNEQVQITRRLLLLLQNSLLFVVSWLLLLFEIGISTKWMSKMPSSMVTFLRRFICKSHLVFVEKGRSLCVDLISPFYGSKHLEASFLNFFHLLLKLVSNSQKLITPYLSKVMVHLTPLP